MSDRHPSAQTTLVILLGASKWPLSSLRGSLAFQRSAEKMREYFCHPHLFDLPTENWLDLFDQYQDSPNTIDQMISDFLARRISQLERDGTPAKDLLFYYIGHGIFDSYSAQEYHLAIQSTRDDNIGASAVAMAALAHTLKTKARHLRRIVILDCCFAARSTRYMQSVSEQVVQMRLQSAFEEKSQGSGFPTRGTALLCSSGADDVSLMLPDESGTLFTEGLIRALLRGNRYQADKTHFSLSELKFLAEEMLETLAQEGAPRPFLSSPDQREGDVAYVPFFPNFYVQREERPAQIPSPSKNLLYQPDAIVPLEAHTGKKLPIGTILLTYKHLCVHEKYSIAWSPDRTRFASSGADGTICIREATTGRTLCIIDHAGGCYDLRWSPDGRMIAGYNAFISLDGWSIWDVTSGGFTFTSKLLLTRAGSLADLEWSPDGQLIAVTSSPNIFGPLEQKQYVEIREIISGKLLQRYEDFSLAASSPTFLTLETNRDVSSVWLIALVGQNDQEIQVLEAVSGSPIYSNHLYDSDHSLTMPWQNRTADKVDQHAKPSPNVVSSMVWSPDSHLLAAANADGIVRIWDAPSSKLLQRYKGHRQKGAVHNIQITWSPDGRLIASINRDTGKAAVPSAPVSQKTIQIWEIASGKLLYRCNGYFRTVEWSPDGKLISLFTDTSSGEILEVASGKILKWFFDNSAVWSRDNRLISLAVGNTRALRPLSLEEEKKDNTVYLLEFLSEKSWQLQQYEGHAEKITSLAWAPDNQLFASVSEYGSVQIWKAILDGYKQLYHSTESYSSHHQACGLVWQSNSRLLLLTKEHTIPTYSIPPTEEYTTLRAWEATSSILVQQYKNHPKIVTATAISPDGRLVATGDTSGTARVWEVLSGKLLLHYNGHFGQAEFRPVWAAIEWSPNGRQIASAVESDSPWRTTTVQVRETLTGKLLSDHNTRGHGLSNVQLSWSPTSHLLAVSSGWTVQVLEAASGKVLCEYEGSGSPFAWSPDGRMIASSGKRTSSERQLGQVVNRKIVEVWEATTGASLFTSHEHKTDVCAVTWSSNGEYIASAAHEVYIWKAP